MRIDHHAYQRATRVAGFGFLIQLGTGLTLLIFGMVAGDTTFVFASSYVLLGLPVWLGLIVLFNQHRLQQLESLEEDELAATRSDSATSMFERMDDEIRVAARRLNLMHRWLMPGLSLLVATALAGTAWLMLVRIAKIKAEEAVFARTEHIGWAVAICLAFAAMSFIFSRFVAGMAKQPAWQNLRGGAAYMVGNVLVCFAVAVGIVFRFFKNDEVVLGIAQWAVPIFLLLLAAEIVFNFVLNLYRPRVVGETPRPAFDSRVLSLFSAPDNLVRTINEAVNYQFGFNVTSSWGYQLLLRSAAKLVILGVGALVLLNMMVVVEPHQQAVKFGMGQLVGDRVHGSGIMWKLPWPFQTAEVYDVDRLRELDLTSRRLPERDRNVHLWSDDLKGQFDTEIEPFVVGSSPPEVSEGITAAIGIDASEAERPGAGDFGGAAAALSEEALREEQISSTISLVDAEIVLHYRIKSEENGLLDYLRFSSDKPVRREKLTVRQKVLKSLALRNISQYLSGLTLDEVLSENRLYLAANLATIVQEAFDDEQAGVDVLAVNLLMLRPSGEAAASFEELSISHQARREQVANAEQQVVESWAALLGDPSLADRVTLEIKELERLRDELGTNAPETLAQRAEVVQILIQGGGFAAQIIALAGRDAWVEQMRRRREAIRHKSLLASYRAAPRLYREREIMRVYATALPTLYKYIIAIDPARLTIDLDLEELDPMLSAIDAIKDQSGDTGQ